MTTTRNAAQRNAAIRPPLKWAGGKRWLVARLATLFTSTGQRRLVEPFCGGLAVCLGLCPRDALLNDINTHAVNFYSHLQKGLRVRIPMRNEQTLYYAHRDEFNRLVTGRGAATSKAAQIFYYLNRTGYNGLCRFNASGEFNVPYGRHKRINYVRDFRPYAVALTKWTFKCGDFQTLRLRESDFVYADPPYDMTFTQYSPSGFNFEQQQRLAHWLSAHSGPVVLSNQATPRILEMYGDLGFECHLVNAPRMISCNGDRKPALEVLALRNLAHVKEVTNDTVVLHGARA